MQSSRRKFIKSSVTVLAVPFIPCGLSYRYSSSPIVSFGLVTDSHYADRAQANNRFYRQSLEKMKAAVETIVEHKVNFIIHLGDVKDQDEVADPVKTLQYLKDIEQALTTFKGPIYHCVGNHDVDSITKSTFLENVVNTGIEKDKSYYSFDYNGIHFMVLDANYDKEGNDHFYQNGVNWQDVRIPEKEVKWIKGDLEATSLPVFVFCHHPLFEYVRDGKVYHIQNREEIQSLFTNSKKVQAVFQGHVHEEKFTKIDGIHYTTQWGMVDYSGLENNTFAIVEIYKNRIVVNGYKRASDKSLILS